MVNVSQILLIFSFVLLMSGIDSSYANHRPNHETNELIHNTIILNDSIVISDSLTFTINTISDIETDTPKEELRDNQKNIAIIVILTIFLMIVLIAFFWLRDNPMASMFGFMAIILLIVMTFVMISANEYGVIQVNYGDTKEVSYSPILEYPDVNGFRLILSWLFFIMTIFLAFYIIIKMYYG